MVDDRAINPGSSPTSALFERLPAALLNVAPERTALFDRLYPDFRIEFVLNNQWVLDHNAADRCIRISTFVAEFVWACGYAHLVYYLDVFQNKSFRSRTEISLRETPRLRRAMDLLKWAVEKYMNGRGPAWPRRLPRPRYRPGFTSDLDIADELALNSVACLIHHELAHRALEHTGGSTIDLERDADAHAWDWMLGGGLDLGFSAGTKRLLAFAHAHVGDVIRDIHSGMTDLSTHPRSVDRLSNLFARWNVPDDHLAVAFTHAVIHLHLENSSHPLRTQSAAYQSYAHALDDVLNHISRFPEISELRKASKDRMNR